MMCLVSVIIPTFNRRMYICETIESVLEQTCRDIELIIVDDGSTDDTRKVLDAQPYRNSFRVLRQENKGKCAARNLGIREAVGEYIAFLDSDDKWRPAHLESLVKILSEHRACDVAFSGFGFFGDQGDVEVQKKAFSESIGVVLREAFDADGGVWVSNAKLFETVLRRGFTFRLIASLVKRDFLRKQDLYFDESLTYTGDAHFFTEAAAFASFVYTQNVSAMIRRHEGNTDRIYSAQTIANSYDHRAERLASFFGGKVKKSEERALRYSIRELRTEAALKRCHGANAWTRILECIKLLVRAPSIGSAKFFIKAALLRKDRL